MPLSQPDKFNQGEESLDLPPPPPVSEGEGWEDEATARLEPDATPRPNASNSPPSNARIPVAAEVPTRLLDDGKSDEWAGRRIGPYLVRYKLARGGMGVVLLAYDEALRRQVALKVMEKGLLNDEDALHRFEREARASASIQHRNIAGVYLVGLSEDNLPFMAMEYIEGGSLMDTIRGKIPLTFGQIATLMEQVADALGAASRLNIIHRDVKPANIMLTRQFEAKVVDFGLAKIFFEDSYVTKEGMVLGTPSYMAPEQSQGRVVDMRADIYSYGATFYHLIAGRAPFIGDSPVQIMMKHVTAPLVPLKTLNPAVPLEFDEIIGRCMRKDVDDRYQNYEELLTDVKRVRLMLVAREQGPVLDSAGGHSSEVKRPTGAFPFTPPGGSSHTNQLPSAVAPRSSVSRASTSQINASGVIPSPPSGMTRRFPNSSEAASRPVPVPSDADSETPSFKWTPTMIASVGAAALVAVVVAALALFGPSAETPQSNGPAPTAAGRQKPLLVQWIESSRDRTAGAGSGGGNPDLRKLEATVGLLESFRGAIESFQTTNNGLPKRLAEVATSEYMVENFAKDETGAALDGWSTPLMWDRDAMAIRSAGKDRNLYSPDDVILKLDGEWEIPDTYESLAGAK